MKNKKSLEERKVAELEVSRQRRTISYNAKEYTLGYLSKLFPSDRAKETDDEDSVEECFYIPDYQREVGIWTHEKKSLFIESLLLGLPIPYVFLYERDEDGLLEIVDGVQRLSTIHSFIEGNLKLRGMDKLKKLEGFSFYDFTESLQRKFKNKTLRAISLYAVGDNTEAFRRDFIFARVNRGGEDLKDAEFRRGSFPGRLTNFIDELSKDELFVKLTPFSVNRYQRFELVLRYLAYIDNYEKVKGHPAKFLDEFLQKNQNEFDKDRYQNEFSAMCKFVELNLGVGAFKNSVGRVANSRYEALSIGITLALREKPDLDTSNAISLLQNDEFNILVRGDGSNNRGRLKGRIEFVRDKLLLGELEDGIY